MYNSTKLAIVLHNSGRVRLGKGKGIYKMLLQDKIFGYSCKHLIYRYLFTCASFEIKLIGIKAIIVI